MDPKLTRRADFRGIKDADDLLGRCIVDEITECWHWQGAMRVDGNGKRSPAMYVWDSQRQMYRTITGPLAVLEVTERRVLGVAMGWRTCQCDDCVNPAHVMGGTRKDFGRWLAGHGLWKNQPARVVANRTSARRRGDLTPELAERIRSSPLTGREEAAALGISPQQVSKVRTGTSWANPVVPGASVFTLGAR